MENDKRKSISSKFIQSITGKVNQLKQSTSFLPSNITDDTLYITQNINSEIDKLITHNEDIEGEANIANLYNRIGNTSIKDNGKNVSLDSIFNSRQLSEQIMPNFIQNRQLLEYEEMIDTIVKYFPTMQDVLDVKKDHVLCADHYTKDFINVLDLTTNKSTSDEEASVFQQNISYIKDKYNLINQYDKFYDITASYGECFIYIKGYNDAIGELLKNKNKNPAYHTESFVLNECFSSQNDNPIKVHKPDTEYSNYLNDISKLEFTINYNKYGYISSAVSEAHNMREILTEQQQNINIGYKMMEKKLVPDKLGFEGIQDGLIDRGNIKENNKDYENPKLDLKGCIVRKLRRENIIPLYFDDDTVVGYFYIESEIQNELRDSSKSNASPFRGNMANMSSIFNNTKSEERKNILTYISDKLSKMIDEKFIKDNQDLKKEIYLVLKNTQILEKGQTQVNAVFIQPQDIIHMKFDEDPLTHRGVSDLDKSIVPASMYINLYTTNTIGILTRGFDKRVYYVKNRVDTNIARTLLNVMNQLKRGNMGTREISNPKTALNITGRYNDVLIPVGQSGDAPVTIENMPGQDIDTKQDLMESLKELAIGPTNVPLDYVDQSKQVDFATRLTMSNYKFLRSIYKRQSLTNPFFTKILQKIYDYEFPDDTVKLKVTLPAPVYINTMGVAEIFRVVNDYSQQIAETEFVNQSDPLIEIKKKIFISEHNKQVMGSQLDRNLISKAKEYADLHASEYSAPNDNSVM